MFIAGYVTQRNDPCNLFRDNLREKFAQSNSVFIIWHFQNLRNWSFKKKVRSIYKLVAQFRPMKSALRFFLFS